MKWYSRIFAFIIISIPSLAHAQVVINEIAWMGNEVSANAEWIELYNTGDQELDLTGWKLTAQDGSPNITLKGSVGAGDYFLLERTSDATVPDVIADQIYTGVLGNEGEILELKNTQGEMVDTVNAPGKWPAGDNTAKKTMQKSGSGWITATGTPGAENQAGSDSDNENPDPEDPDTDDTDNGNEEPDTENPPAKSPAQSRVKIIPVEPDPKYEAKMIIPDFSTRGVPVPINVEIIKDKKLELMRGKMQWSMGDGRMYTVLKNTEFFHTFHHAGEYTIVMTYYSSILKEKPDSIHKKKITIVDHAITITDITQDGGIVFKNDTSKEIDLYNWSLNQNNIQYIFPQYTTVLPKKTLTVSAFVTGIPFDTNHEVILKNPHQKTISIFSFHKSNDSTQGESFETEELPEDFGKLNEPALVPGDQPPRRFSWVSQYLYLIIAGGVLVLSILAYLVYDLYANKDTWSDEDLD